MRLPPHSKTLSVLYPSTSDMKDSLKDIFHRYPIQVAFVAVVILGLLLHFTFSRRDTAEVVVPEDAQVSDTLALNILCSPTWESLPLYHAVESGLCDSLHLSLVIHTATSQFDIDSIMRRTRRIDGAVLDEYRLQHYKTTKKPLPVQEVLTLQGSWRILSSAKLRIREISKLKKRPVATARFATSSHLLEEKLRVTGLKPTDLYHAQINDYQTRLEMLDGAQVDACILPEPYATLARLKGHRVLAANDTVQSLKLCFRSKVLKNKHKQAQIELLKQVYSASLKDLRRHGVHAADSALIKAYNLPQATLDSLRYQF